MADGEWDYLKKDHPITINREGAVMEGMHRLLAVSLSPEPIMVHVTFETK